MEKLTLGEVKCKKCKGKGLVKVNALKNKLECMCPKCFGTGKLDWIEVVIGKRGFSSSSVSTGSSSNW